MRWLFVLAIVAGALLIVSTPLAAANLMRIWPAPVFYGAGIAVYAAVVAGYVVWGRRRAPVR